VLRDDMSGERFADAIVSFYDEFLKATADTLDKLASIQEKHKEYEEFKNIQKDPAKMYESLSEKLTDKERRILLDLLITVSRFETRLRRLYELKPKEQRELAKDLREFMSKFSNVLKEGIEVHEK
jgi:flagellar biosynthesis chaperone FliJ